jgi:hypothetical protein
LHASIRLWRWRCSHLRQRCLSLRQPKGHLHGAVHRRGQRQFGAGLLALTSRGIQRAQVSVAVGLERAHAEFDGQGEGLLLGGFSVLAVQGSVPRRNLAEEMQGIRLVATFLVRTDERQRPLSKALRLLQAAG